MQLKKIKITVIKKDFTQIYIKIDNLDKKINIWNVFYTQN